jgi:hypothetical protein
MGETAEQKKQRIRQENLQRLRGMRPIDDDFMRCIFRGNTELAQKVLRILLQNKGLNVLSVETQADMKRLAGARSICLDVLGVDDTGKKYDIEIQRADKGAGAHRARYHSSVLDVESLHSGDEFEALPETYIIFITENDIYNQGLPYYRIERINIDTGEDEIGKLMHDFSCSNPDDMLDEELAKISRYYKETQEGVEAVCKVMEDMRNEAALENSREIAERMIAKGTMSYEEIAELTALSLSEVQKLAGAETA